MVSVSEVLKHVRIPSLIHEDDPQEVAAYCVEVASNALSMVRDWSCSLLEFGEPASTQLEVKREELWKSCSETLEKISGLASSIPSGESSCMPDKEIVIATLKMLPKLSEFACRLAEADMNEYIAIPGVGDTYSDMERLLRTQVEIGCIRLELLNIVYEIDAEPSRTSKEEAVAA